MPAIVWPGCEVVLCVSVIMGTESSEQAGAVEKRPRGSEALSCHYWEGRPDNNGDIMRAADRLPFSKMVGGQEGSFAVSHHNRLTAIDWSLACLKKRSFNCSCRGKQMPAVFVFRGGSDAVRRPILVQPDTRWDSVEAACVKPAVIYLLSVR